MINSQSFSGHITYQEQINPVFVKKQLQISLDNNQGVLGLLEPSKKSAFETEKLVFHVLDTGDQFFVKTSLLEKEMRKVFFGNFDYQAIFQGKSMLEGKPVLNPQEKVAYKAELVKRFFSLKEAGAHFSVPIRFFTVKDLTGLLSEEKKEVKNPVVYHDLKEHIQEPIQNKNLVEIKKSSLSEQELLYQQKSMENERTLIQSLRSNLENDYETDLAESDIDLVINKFSEILENNKSITIESDQQLFIQQKKTELKKLGKEDLIFAFEYVLERSKGKYI
jgi:hypothetical protein